MNDTNIPDDQFDIPESEPRDFSEGPVRRGVSPGLKLGFLVVGVFAILGLSLFLSTSEVGEQSEMRGAPSLDATPGGSLQSENPLFQDLLQQANDERAQAAIERGETFIPIPEGRLEPVIRPDALDAGDGEREAALEGETSGVGGAAPPPSPPEPRIIQQRIIPSPSGEISRPVIASTAPQQQVNPYVQGMIQQMGSMTSAMNRQATMVAIQDVPETREDQAQFMAQEDAAPEPGQDTGPMIPSGAILYGETLTSSSSDLPGPVLVEVTTGPFKGSRLVGTFSTADSVNRMVVEFISMTLPDGSSTAVNAFAVDGVSAETAVASDVNRRYLKRYAPILAAAFITGYASSASQPDQQVVELGDGNSVVTGTTTQEQNLYAGLAAATEAIGSDLLRTAPQGPEVKLRAGWPVGIMFVEPVLQ